MSLKTVTELHKVSHTRTAHNPGAGGGLITVKQDQGDKFCTINPDADFESLDFDQRNEQIGVSIYFNTDPLVQTNDILTMIGVRDVQTGIMETVTNGDVYRVQSVLNFQRQNRLWRVRATRQTAIPK